MTRRADAIQARIDAVPQDADVAARPVRVLRNGVCRARVATVEAAVSHIADATGKHPEFVFDEVRHERAVLNDQGDQAEWSVDDQTEYS